MRSKVFVFLAVIMVSCTSNVPKGILPEREMKQVTYDLMQVDEYFTSFLLQDSAIDLKKRRTIMYEQVFKLHNTTRKQFYNSFRYYQQNPSLQKKIFDSISETINRPDEAPKTNQAKFKLKKRP